MSLLNDALHDLDVRGRQHRFKIDSVTCSTSDELRVIKQHNKIWFIAILCVATLTSYMYFGQSSENKTVINALASSEWVDISPPSLLNNTSTAESFNLVNAPSDALYNIKQRNNIEKNPVENVLSKPVLHAKLYPASNHNDKEDNDKKVFSENSKPLLNELLLKAERAMADNRLTVPFKNNAMYFLGEAEKISKNNIEIKKIKEKVKMFFLAQLDYTLKNNRLDKVGKLMERWSVFDINDKQKNEYLTLFNKAKVNDISKVNADSGQVSSHALEKISNINDYSSLNNEKWTTPTEYLNEETRVLAEVKKLLLHNRVKEIQKYISEVDPKVSDNIYKLVFNYYIDSHRITNAEQLTLALSNSHSMKNYFKARLAYYRHDLTLAIAILEKSIVQSTGDSLYYSLLAALYQKRNRHDDARAIYKDLLHTDTTNVTFLLGYAISSDALHDNAKSTAAYQQVLQVGHPSSQVMDFAKQRIADIKRDSAEKSNLGENGVGESILW